LTERPAGPITVVGAHVGGLLMQVDAVPREGETVLGHSFEEPEDGGKATNQAVAAARLGAPTRVVTLLGDDERGDRWLATLTRYGVDMRFVLRAAGPTDVGVVLLPPSRVPAIVSSITLSAQLDGAAVASAAGALADASVVLCQLEAPPSCALAAFALAREAGARTVLNPAPAVPLDSALLALTDVLVPNEHEAAVLAGVDEPPAALAAALARLHPAIAVIVTAGSAGCFLAEPGGAVEHLPAPSVDVVDTTGAGDAFVAALAVRLRAGDALRVAAEFAIRAAALSVTRPGTMPAFAVLGELDARVAPEIKSE
jgi:ribokinase